MASFRHKLLWFRPRMYCVRTLKEIIMALQLPWHKACVILGFIVILDGCMHLPQNINVSETTAQLPPNTGFLVGSVTQTSDGDPSPFHSTVSLTFGPLGDSKSSGSSTFRLRSGEDTHHLLLPESWYHDRGLEDVNGRLFATAVIPGTYALLGFRIEGSGYKYHKIANPITFQVSSGEVVYLGNLDAAFCVRHAYANQYGVSGVRLSVNDRADRDVPLLKNKVLALRNTTVQKRLLDGDELKLQTIELSKWCDCDHKCNSDL